MDFLGVLIFFPFDHPCHLKSRVPPWAQGRACLTYTGLNVYFSTNLNDLHGVFKEA